MAARLPKRKRPYSVRLDGPEGTFRVTVPLAAMNDKRVRVFSAIENLIADLVTKRACRAGQT